jgi:SWI/SNF-related matrix-associated actin-dependent regulator 1 of chromatin subfamily A
MATLEGTIMKVRFFPAQAAGECAICGKSYNRLSMVGFYPAASISHQNCIINPSKQKSVKAPVIAVGNELTDFKARVNAAINPGLTPFDYQYEGALAVDKYNGRLLIGDEQGLGKTIQAILWLAVNAKARPAIVIVPASVKINWQREIEKWLPRNKHNIVKVLSGQKPTALLAMGIYVINYDIVKHWLKAIKKIKPQVVIADECQYLKNSKAQRTIAILGKKGANSFADSYLLGNVPTFIPLSGTPITNRPIEFFPVLNALRPDRFSNWMGYATRYCGAYKSQWGWVTTGASNTAELNKKVTESCMIRRLKTQVMSQLPAKRRSVVSLDIVNRNEYALAEKDIIEWMKANGQDIRGALRAEALVKLEKLKQIAVKGKLDSVTEWIKNQLESEPKVVVFVHHREILAQLMADLKEFNPVSIQGGDTDIQRTKAVDTFQTVPTCRAIICSIKAAGLGITLTAASTTVTVELVWTPAEHNQAEDRIHRIGQTEACTNYYLIADGTIEEKIAKVISKKQAVLSAVLDGTQNLSPDEDILNLLTREMAA